MLLNRRTESEVSSSLIPFHVSTIQFYSGVLLCYLQLFVQTSHRSISAPSDFATRPTPTATLSDILYFTQHVSTTFRKNCFRKLFLIQWLLDLTLANKPLHVHSHLRLRFAFNCSVLYYSQRRHKLFGVLIRPCTMYVIWSMAPTSSSASQISSIARRYSSLNRLFWSIWILLSNTLAYPIIMHFIQNFQEKMLVVPSDALISAPNVNLNV